MQYLGANSKTTEWSLFVSKANHSISWQSKSMPWQWCCKSWSWMVLWRSTRPSRTNTQKKRCPFHYRGLKCKSRKSRNTWSKRQIWPWSTEWSREKANRLLPREHTGHRKTLFQQQKRRLYTWRSPDGQYRNQMGYILCTQRRRSSIRSAKTRPGADCGSNHELLIARFRLKLKKVGKTTRPFRNNKSNPLWLYSGGEKDSRD